MAELWKVPVVWSMMGHLTVEADTAEEAVREAQRLAATCPLPDDGAYLEDSFEVDTAGLVMKASETRQ